MLLYVLSYSDMEPDLISLSPVDGRLLSQGNGIVWETSLEVSLSGSLGLYRHTDYICTLISTFLQSHSCSILLIIFFSRTDEMNSLAGCKHLLNSADGATSECLQVNWWNRGTTFIFMSVGNEKYTGQKYMVKIYRLLKTTALASLCQRACPGFNAKNWYQL